MGNVPSVPRFPPRFPRPRFPDGKGIVDCAKALAELTAATANVDFRLADFAVHGWRPDAGHIKALSQAIDRLKEALDKVKRHCACYAPLAAAVAAAIKAAEEAIQASEGFLSEAAAAAGA